jgi:hypothetical protein
MSFVGRAERVSFRPEALVTGLFVALAAVWLVGMADFLVRAANGTYGIVDFHTYYEAAKALEHGHSPYPAPADPVLATNMAYVYPPLTAIAAIPLTLVPLHQAAALEILALTAAVLGTLRVLGVRDWRCYVLALCWRPVLFGILTGNVTVLLGLGVAVAWRFRDRRLPVASSVAVVLAAKVFLWPLVVWLGATRRYAAAALSLAAAVLILAASWAAIGFSGLGDYPEILRRVGHLQERDTYTAYALALGGGASPTLARALGLVLACALLAGVLVLGLRRHDFAAFALAIAASLAFTPIVWLHYYALLLVVVAIAEPRLGPAWFLPLAMWIAPGVAGTPFQKAVVLVVAGATIVVALRPRLVRRQLASERVPAALP